MERDARARRRLTPADASLLEVILDSIAEGVFTIDREGRITTFNRAAEEITGFRREEAIGRWCFEVFRADICQRDCALRRTIETGRPVVGMRVTILNKQGQEVPVSITTAVLRDARGEVIGGVETFRDLSLVEELRREADARYGLGDIVGKSPRLQEILRLLPDVAESESTVLITGESGTGKELLARAIHELSPRRDGPYVRVNCAAIPETLLESELFGYVRGAFTDARRDKPGRFALAEGGTILLDEIAEVPLGMQAKLLRVLQEREYEPLGGTRTLRANVRVIATTNRDLAALVKEGRFPGGPLLAPQGDPPPPAAPAGAARGHPPAGRALRAPPGHAHGKAHPGPHPGGHGGAAALALSRERPGARERHRAGAHPGRGR